ncbi:MAG: helix-turn-helix domain-containing protein [Saprospiraceae bacterium]|jgi:transcriptional regulator with XRE-family HTH domain|nr:helix-turn-helix domain-containing protein [Saprospiraceae bacterium]
MLKAIDTVKLIFGLKVQQLRKERQLSYQQLSEKTKLAISYLHNIEKGKKYPKADKIMALADALDSDYNYLVSLQADKKLQPIIDLLHSDFLKVFPLELFGINTPKLIELLSQAPSNVNAFISTVIKITRNFNMQGEDFYKAALRSYQDLHDNYFEDIEKAVNQLRDEQDISTKRALSSQELEKILLKKYQIHVNRSYLETQKTLKEVRSFFAKSQKTLYINKEFSIAQENFLLAKELGFQVLKLKDRPYETRMTEVDSFDKLLNNFKASYFAVAFLMNEDFVIEEVENMAQWKQWDNDAFLALLDRYQVTPEMLLQRLANILPRHFGIKDIFFLRFYTNPAIKKFIMTKEMHLSQLHDPHANQLDEHYCRRWISISLIRKLRAMQSIEEEHIEPIVDAQISNYTGTSNSYFAIAIAKTSRTSIEESVSVTIGLLINNKLKKLFRFLENNKLVVREVNTTCERCPISDCGARAIEPVFLQRKKKREYIKSALKDLKKNTAYSK